ncbi:MAG: hypothetical protein M1815_004251 [Lichina confinis]|nr:MAG: hypothetical protein M1815_004251 [Lichina confinis]
MASLLRSCRIALYALVFFWLHLGATCDNSTLTVDSTVLVFARDSGAAGVATGPLNGYGIPHQVVVVPQTGVTLPALTSSATQGNFGLVVIISAVTYDYGPDGGWRSALTAAQQTELRDYVKNFGVRLVQLDVYPGPDYGATALGGCCGGEEQLFKLSDNSDFPTAGLKVGATLSSTGLWHYPASITDTATTKAFLQFEPNSQFSTSTVAGVINNFADGLQQMAFFTSFGTWSQSSTFMAHAWIHWGLRGLYPGFRRVLLSAQIDDVFLSTGIYDQNQRPFRVRPADMQAHVSWTADVNSRMNAGSNFFIELGHNGNGNIIQGAELQGNKTACAEPIYYDFPPATPLEFQKPLGTGKDLWPTTPSTFNWPAACLDLDPLKQWIATPANRDAFGHVTHTFTHLPLNNATYSDCRKEITFNQAWMAQIGIAASPRFSGKGIIPPQITGLHNGDCLRAWVDSGLTNAVGDNTRPPLRNSANDYWPLHTTVADNGYDGYTIVPRWASNIYFNCDTTACTVLEWQQTASGVGDVDALLQLEKVTNTRYLLGLHQDPYMFHQANMRQTDVPSTTINGVSKQLSLLQVWVEVVTQEMTRLVNWPIITHKHDDIARDFERRFERDSCAPKLRLSVDGATKKVTGFDLVANGNTCTVPVPVTVPNPVVDTKGATTEKLGNDPTTLWVQMSGSSYSFQLSTAV